MPTVAALETDPFPVGRLALFEGDFEGDFGETAEDLTEGLVALRASGGTLTLLVIEPAEGDFVSEALRGAAAFNAGTVADLFNGGNFADSVDFLGTAVALT